MSKKEVLEMNVLQNIKNGKYSRENFKSHEEMLSAIIEMRELFKNDLFMEFGVQGHKHRELLYNVAVRLSNQGLRSRPEDTYEEFSKLIVFLRDE